MKFKNDFPKDTEWIMNFYIGDDKKDFGKPKYQFVCWKHGSPDKTLFKAETRTASALAKKIDKFLAKKLKLKIGNYYYYAKSKRKMLCVKIGKKLSWFTDYKKSKYQFYNADMYLTKF